MESASHNPKDKNVQEKRSTDRLRAVLDKVHKKYGKELESLESIQTLHRSATGKESADISDKIASVKSSCVSLVARLEEMDRRFTTMMSFDDTRNALAIAAEAEVHRDDPVFQACQLDSQREKIISRAAGEEEYLSLRFASFEEEKPAVSQAPMPAETVAAKPAEKAEEGEKEAKPEHASMPTRPADILMATCEQLSHEFEALKAKAERGIASCRAALEKAKKAPQGPKPAEPKPAPVADSASSALAHVSDDVATRLPTSEEMLAKMMKTNAHRIHLSLHKTLKQVNDLLEEYPLARVSELYKLALAEGFPESRVFIVDLFLNGEDSVGSAIQEMERGEILAVCLAHANMNESSSEILTNETYAAEMDAYNAKISMIKERLQKKLEAGEMTVDEHADALERGINAVEIPMRTELSGRVSLSNVMAIFELFHRDISRLEDFSEYFCDSASFAPTLHDKSEWSDRIGQIADSEGVSFSEAIALGRRMGITRKSCKSGPYNPMKARVPSEVLECLRDYLAENTVDPISLNPASRFYKYVAKNNRGKQIREQSDFFPKGSILFSMTAAEEKDATYN